MYSQKFFLKRISIITIGTIALIAVAARTSRADTNRISVTVTNQVWSGYLLENAFVAHNKPVNQADIALTKGKFYLDIWGSTGFRGQSNGGREIDWTLGYSGTYIDTGISYYDLNPLFSNRRGDIIKMFVEGHRRIALQNHELMPYLRFSYHIATLEPGKNSGSFTRVGLNDSWSLTDRISVRQGTWLLYDNGVYGSDHGFLFDYWGELDYSLGHGITIAPIAWRASVPISGIHDRHPNCIMGSWFSISF